MQSNFKLNIPKPCHENWEEFMSSSKGNFCNSCQKNVIDFTQMSESQLVAYFRDLPAQENKICGRFRNDQLQKDYHINDWFPNWNIQNNQVNYEIPMSRFLEKSSTISLPFISNMKVVRNVAMAILTLVFAEQGFGQTRLLSGKVVDGTDSSMAIPGLTIHIKGTARGTQTDKSGNYKITVDEKDILIFSFVGYIKKELKPREVKEVLKFEPDASQLGEVVVIGEGGVCDPDDTYNPDNHKTDIFIESQTKNEAILKPKIHQNSLFYNDSLRKSIKEWYEKNGFQEVREVEVYDESGKVYKSNFRVVNDGKVWLNITLIPIGKYYLRITLSNERSSGEEETAVTQLVIDK